MKPDETEIKSRIAYWKTRLNESPADEMEFWIGLIAEYQQYLGLDDCSLGNYLAMFLVRQLIAFREAFLYNITANLIK